MNINTNNPAPSGDAPTLTMTADDFARELRIARRTFDRLQSSKLLPAPDIRIGRKIVRWRRETVVAAVAALANEGWAASA